MSDRDDAAADALVRVSRVPEDIENPDRAFAELNAAIAAAAEAPASVLWAWDPRDPRTMILSVHGGSPDAERRIGQLWESIDRPTRERVVRATEPGSLASVLHLLDAREGWLVPVAGNGAVAGLCLVTGFSGPDDRHPLRIAAVRLGARDAGRALRAHLLRANLERAMAQVLVADERMLGRMGLDIHDGPTQQLSVALLEVQLLEAELGDADRDGLPLPADLRPAIGRIYETVGGALHEMRELIGHLRPAQFEDRRLDDILKDAIRAFERRTDCRVDAHWAGEFPVNGVSITQRITLYRNLQETLSNAHRHGHARNLRVGVLSDHRGVTLTVRDDGDGFDPDAVQQERSGVPLARFGLHGMRDRAQVLDGSFEIISAPGSGAEVRVFLPRWSAAGQSPTQAPEAE